jgi:HEAT repeat protein
MIKLVRCFSRTFDWVHRHPARAAMALFLLSLAVLMGHAKFTEQDQFNSSFERAAWNWFQAGEHARPLDPQERRKLIEQLSSTEPPERWNAAGELAFWREPAALWPLVAAMQDDAGTRRTCVISQALGKLGAAAAVPALVQAAQHPSNVDLRACATHSLGQIGDDRAVPFLAGRSVDRSLSKGDRSVAISALGGIGSPLALPVLKEIASGDTRPMLRSMAASAIRQIGLLQGDAERNLLSAIGDNSDWIKDDWILAQLHRRWSEHIAAGLNEILRARAEMPSALRLQITALLSAKQAVEQTTLDSLALSSEPESRWLASLVRNGFRFPAPRVVRIFL